MMATSKPFRALIFCSLVLLLGLLASSSAFAAGLRYTIAVSQFENRSNWSGQYQLGDAYGAVLTDVLNQSGKYIVLGEKDMRSDAASESGQAGSAAQLLVKGVITHVQNTSNSGGGISFGGVLFGGAQSESEINVTMYIVDTASGRVLASKSIVGKSSGGGVLIGGGGAVFGTQHKDNMGKAVENAIAQSVVWMDQQLPAIKWSGLVVLNENGSIYINRGSREGVSVGQRLIVGQTRVLRDPISKEVLDETLSEIATLEVTTVKEKLSICSVVSGLADGIETGMKVLQP
ncbi:CsgG/HfaB family protein [Azotosporobacter soli]|uniref:CsgG/HfaB family protein n=1 Tax=Azotosporobacter soli TaxID=3055040 RepID=UPI0031FF476C